MARTLDPAVDDAIATAALSLLRTRGFARLSLEEVAREAGVGKPAVYRRFRNKAALVADVIARQLPALDVADVGETRAELWRAVEHGLPPDGPAYVRLIGGLMAERDRHPELIDAFREKVLLPRRAILRTVIEHGQARRDQLTQIDPEAALDLMAGSFLARVFAGLDTGPAWRTGAFDTWWQILSKEQRTT